MNEEKADKKTKVSKKSKGKSKIAKNSDPTEINHEEYIKNLQELYEREREQRCCFQLERDKLVKIRDVDRERYNELKIQLLEAEDKLIKYEEYHTTEIENLRKKIKYLIGERDMKINGLKLQVNVESKINLEMGLEDRNLYLNGIRESVKKLNEDRLNLDEAIKNLTLENEIKISEIHNEYTKTVLSIQKACEMRFNGERDNFSLILRNAIHEIAEAKNSQIAQIKQLKDKAFEDMRTYFKELNQNLMNHIQDLTKRTRTIERDLKDMEAKKHKYEVECEKLKLKNDSLSKENYSLNLKSNLYIKNSRVFQLRNVEFNDLKDKYKDLDLKYEALLKTYENLKAENNRLEQYIQNLVLKFKQKNETFKYFALKTQEKQIKLLPLNLE
ncbi:unnamed protein product [Brachionus calyciflorus]|uniref:Growth arrest-specific protein 8 domain-containing protein n=1 Tax=Brachionus calyciflorus TaxID=104777 RepID=A0A813VN91_9BILA|nr:unnamed protein product [Brachionus calyciflorus]